MTTEYKIWPENHLVPDTSARGSMAVNHIEVPIALHAVAVTDGEQADVTMCRRPYRGDVGPKDFSGYLGHLGCRACAGAIEAQTQQPS